MSDQTRTGVIFDIQRFSVDDGPGIRTTVFFKGCNLRCAWCHNPESWDARPQLQFYPDKCIGCNACREACPANAITSSHFLRERCASCGQCAEVCYAGARVLTGRALTVDEVLGVVLKDALFYKNSGGGMTASGGEPMLQIAFLEELLREAKRRGIHTAVDTAGSLAWPSFQRILPYADLFLYDIKAADPALHRRWTGGDNALIFSNLRRLTDAGARVWVRVPAIPGVNANVNEMRAIGRLLLENGPVEQVELLNYHRLGATKYNALGMNCPMPEELAPLGEAELDELRGLLRGMGLGLL